ncbi:major facilitator superfamily transporter [Ceratobasidium sp. AG-Ba]|nr:major facilitator superfamily transporter [Ceratobasidium sp. AG-Ba]QRW04623.1 major facilitator superfamily transporter [Ceratobasidium sp. AG-Ba]
MAEHFLFPLRTIFSFESVNGPQPRSTFSGNGISHANISAYGGQRNITGGIDEDPTTPLPPVDRGIKAWSFIVGAFILETLVWGLGFSYGVFQEYHISNNTFNKVSEAAIGAVGTTTLAIGYFECLIVILAAQHWPDKIWHLQLLQGICFGIGCGGLYAPVLIYLSEWFSIGGAVFPVTINLLLERFGFRWTLRIFALGILILGVAALKVTRARLPVHWSFLLSPLFLSVSSTVFIQALAYFPVSLYMSVYTASLGLPPSSGTLVLAVFNLASVTGQILFGHLCDIVPYPYVMIGSGAGAALSAYLLWGFAHSLPQVFAFVVIFGSLSGGFSSMFPAASVQIAGSEGSVSNVIGVLSAVKGIAAIVGPLVAAALHRPQDKENKSSYGGYGFSQVTVFVGSMMVATAAGGITTRIVGARSGVSG